MYKKDENYKISSYQVKGSSDICPAACIYGSCKIGFSIFVKDSVSLRAYYSLISS